MPRVMDRRTTLKISLAATLVAMLPTKKVQAQSQSGKARHWAVYYDSDLTAPAFDGLDLVVLDQTNHPPLDGFRERGIQTFGYVSLGEINQHRPYFKYIEDLGALLDPNPFWPDARMIDIRRQEWTALLIEDVIPAILHRGFDGLFFDTLDNAGELERQEPEKNAGMVAAARQLVRAIRRHFPDTPLIMNRGYELLPEIGPHIDFVLGESVYTDYNFDTKTYSKVDAALYQQQVDILRQAREVSPHLTILTLDYWPPDDLRGLRDIYQAQRDNGFVPYVATIELNRFVPEPKP